MKLRTEWEYMAQVLGLNENFVATINKYGAEGWEVVYIGKDVYAKIYQELEGIEGKYLDVLFKREKL